MDSRISAAIDFNNGNKTCINIVQRESEDVRDGIVSSFLQSFATEDRYAKIVYVGENEYEKHYRIVPLDKEEIKKALRPKV